MTPQDTIAWFEELVTRKITFHPRGRTTGRVVLAIPAYYELAEASAWLTEAQSALESVFPPAHAVMKRWDAILKKANDGAPDVMSEPSMIDAARAAFQAALAQVKQGRLRTLVQSTQAETVSELLEQAAFLLAEDKRVAATVIAGGALETHLRHLCVQHAITWKGDGSISKYDGAIAQERNQTGREIYSATDTKNVGAWGGLRNEAAHNPTTFQHSAEEVRILIESVRQFIARTS